MTKAMAMALTGRIAFHAGGGFGLDGQTLAEAIASLDNLTSAPNMA